MKLQIVALGAVGLMLAGCYRDNEAAPAPADTTATTETEGSTAAGDASSEGCENAQNTLEINECAALEVKAAEAELKAYTAAAIENIQQYPSEATAMTVAELKASEQAFEAYAKKACDAVYAYWSDGTIRGQMGLTCRYNLLKDRTHHIWREYLISMEGSAPLPEPKRVNVEYRLDTGEDS